MLLEHFHPRHESAASRELVGRLIRAAKHLARWADTTTIRVILANASLLWTLDWITDPQAFERPEFGVLLWIAPAWAWALGFLLHFVGVYWRLLDPKGRPLAALIVNSYGFLLWFISTASISVAAGWFSPGNALEWTMCAAGAWALYRTGLNREMVSP